MADELTRLLREYARTVSEDPAANERRLAAEYQRRLADRPAWHTRLATVARACWHRIRPPR